MSASIVIAARALGRRQIQRAGWASHRPFSTSDSSSQTPSTTYSGGHPYEGQGGFYGSIKSRSDLAAEFVPGARAEAADVQQLDALVAAWDAQKNAIDDADAQSAAWNALVRDDVNAALIKRLIVKGGPAWGLSSKQREFVSRFHPV
ncbi:hypothetical protein PybrP1_004330 [[Pythium] brassicae (nom. inval.)]|nr:hypothetical protein PybrP1_004330 [[Pythium] brassicae (nom. inval.)]